MLKLICKLTDTMTLEIETTTQKDGFEQLASSQEVFGESTCGKCGKNNLKYQVRVVDDNKYYELRCKDCGSVLAFGSHKKGESLFPKRKTNDGEFLDNKGWTKWDGTKKE